MLLKLQQKHFFQMMYGWKTAADACTAEKRKRESKGGKKRTATRFIAYSRFIPFVFRAASSSQTVAFLTRYLAFMNDVGEAFRPVATPWVVRGAYGVSWAYVFGDVAYDAYQLRQKHDVHGKDLAVAVSKRLTWQAMASIIFPAVTIHTAVNQSKRVCRRMGQRCCRWGPTAVGLCLLPALPFMFDQPLERVCDAVFDPFWTPPPTVVEEN